MWHSVARGGSASLAATIRSLEAEVSDLDSLARCLHSEAAELRWGRHQRWQCSLHFACCTIALCSTLLLMDKYLEQ